MTHQPSHPPSDPVPSLLHTALQTYQRGEHATARALVRRLAARHAEDSRVWMTLARIAETRAEQRHALERVLVFDPANQTALRGLARFDELNSRPAAVPPPRVAPATERAAPSTDEDQTADEVADEAAEIRWPLYAVVGVALLVVLVAYLLLRPSNETASGQPTPPLPGAGVGAATGAATSPGAGEADVSATSVAVPPAPTLPAVIGTASVTEVIPAAPSALGNTGEITAEASAVAAPPVGPTVPARLPAGQLVTVGNWTASLLRPAYATMLNGSIAALQPQGRFVLALMSVANSGAPQPIPENLFTLVDGQGRRYQPIPAASTVYIQTYGQAQAGDFSMEQPIPGGNRTWSVPIIFDVPASAQSLTLQVGDTLAGWPVEMPGPPASASG